MFGFTENEWSRIQEYNEIKAEAEELGLKNLVSYVEIWAKRNDQDYQENGAPTEAMIRHARELLQRWGR